MVQERGEEESDIQHRENIKLDQGTFRKPLDANGILKTVDPKSRSEMDLNPQKLRATTHVPFRPTTKPHKVS